MKSWYSLFFIIAPLFAPYQATTVTTSLQPAVRTELQAPSLHTLVRAANLSVTTKRLFTSAIILFFATPGFPETLVRALEPTTNGYINGHVYEIKKAMNLAQNNHTIHAFNAVQSAAGIAREFDLIVQDFQGNQFWIECKAGRFKNKYKPQIVEQQRIAQETDPTIFYKVCFKKIIEPHAKKWFHQEGIPFEEDNES